MCGVEYFVFLICIVRYFLGGYICGCICGVCGVSIVGGCLFDVGCGGVV